MSGIKGFKMWLMTELLYDEFGNATIIRSFMKPSKDSTIKQGQKKSAKKVAKFTPKSVGKEVDLF